jgi:hypothetical protein
VGVGAARSGTSWWTELISQHPDVTRAPGLPKEVHFFDAYWSGRFVDADIERYHRFFPRPPGARTGEWTPGYMLDYWTPPLLRRAAPDARLLVLLRDPVERFRSGISRAENRLTLGRRAIPSPNHAFQRGLYADQLCRLWAVFPRERTLVLQYEICVRDPAGQVARTFTFLGLDPRRAPSSDFGRRVNAARGPKPRLRRDQLAGLIHGYAVENARLAELVPELDLTLWTGRPA